MQNSPVFEIKNNRFEKNSLVAKKNSQARRFGLETWFSHYCENGGFYEIPFRISLFKEKSPIVHIFETLPSVVPPDQWIHLCFYQTFEKLLSSPKKI